MTVVREAGELEPARRAAAIGTFDGVHLGHRRVIDAARAAGLRSVVVTFVNDEVDQRRYPSKTNVRSS